MNDKIKITGENWTALKMELGDELIVNSILNNKLNKKFPSVGTIYHYTTLSSLISIIETQTIFSTNINFLNDKKEFKFGVGQILSVLDKLRLENLEYSVLNMVEKKIDQIYKSERYVTCFSKNGDLLSQWRAYSNNGKGVAIGFNSSLFKSSIKQFISGKHIFYDEPYQLKVIEELIKIILAFFEKRKEIIEWADYGYEQLVASTILEFLGNIIATYKHPSFREEKEYRFEYTIDGNMIKKGKENILFKSSDTIITPYIRLKDAYKQYTEDKAKGIYDDIGADRTFAIKQLPIDKIIVGPSLDFESIKQGIKELLDKNNYENVKIKKSRIPYRI